MPLLSVQASGSLPLPRPRGILPHSARTSYYDPVTGRGALEHEAQQDTVQQHKRGALKHAFGRAATNGNREGKRKT